jgi:hypothetical protein
MGHKKTLKALKKGLETDLDPVWIRIQAQTGPIGNTIGPDQTGPVA